MKPVEHLASLLTEMNIVVARPALELSLRHLAWVLKANERLNLTAPMDWDAAVRLHLLDSLAALPEVEDSAPGLVVDLGTGGGFPGVPLAVSSNRSAVLVDSVAKKLSAVEEYLASEGLERQISTFKGRSEELASLRPALASIVVARAVAELPVLLELASPLLKNGGSLIALKGRPLEQEVERSMTAARTAGFDVPSIRRYTLPGGDEARAVFTFRKIGEPTIVLPRRAGMAKKRPLA